MPDQHILHNEKCIAGVLCPGDKLPEMGMLTRVSKQTRPGFDTAR